MTEKSLRNLIIVLCCCLTVVLAYAIVISCLYFTSDVDDGTTVDYSQLTYVALGDSITYGYDWSKNGQQMDNPYCELVKNALKLKSVVNYGINSSTVCTGVDGRVDMCVRYKSMQDNADIVSVMGGVNDFGCWVSLGEPTDKSTTTFYGALNTLAQGLKEKYPNAFIFFMTPLKWQNNENKTNNGGTLDDFRTAIKTVCDIYDIAVLDTATLADFSTEYNLAEYKGDGLHPTQAFVSGTLAPLITQFIRDNYGKG